ncbi:hypothetical protein ACOMHN_021767 [Nucella lapillus]
MEVISSLASFPGQLSMLHVKKMHKTDIPATVDAKILDGKGKATAWEVWRTYPQATEAFLSLAAGPHKLPDICFQTLERFVVLLYDRTSQTSKVNSARQCLFSRRSRTIENIPPTQAALKQHVLRATYQG